MKRPKSSRTPKGRSRPRKRALAIVMLVIVGVLAFVTFYAWEYRPQTLVNETTTIKESFVWQMNVDVTFGSRNVEITVETLTHPVLVTFWWQKGATIAKLYLGNQLVDVNSPSTMNVSVHDSGGIYYLMVQKSEVACAPCTNCEDTTCVTTINVVVRV